MVSLAVTHTYARSVIWAKVQMNFSSPILQAEAVGDQAQAAMDDCEVLCCVLVSNIACMLPAQLHDLVGAHKGAPKETTRIWASVHMLKAQMPHSCAQAPPPACPEHTMR